MSTTLEVFMIGRIIVGALFLGYKYFKRRQQKEAIQISSDTCNDDVNASTLQSQDLELLYTEEQRTALMLICAHQSKKGRRGRIFSDILGRARHDVFCRSLTNEQLECILTALVQKGDLTTIGKAPRYYANPDILQKTGVSVAKKYTEFAKRRTNQPPPNVVKNNNHVKRTRS